MNEKKCPFGERKCSDCELIVRSRDGSGECVFLTILRTLIKIQINQGIDFLKK